MPDIVTNVDVWQVLLAEPRSSAGMTTPAAEGLAEAAAPRRFTLLGVWRPR